MTTLPCMLMTSSMAPQRTIQNFIIRISIERPMRHNQEWVPGSRKYCSDRTEPLTSSRFTPFSSWFKSIWRSFMNNRNVVQKKNVNKDCKTATVQPEKQLPLSNSLSKVSPDKRVWHSSLSHLKAQDWKIRQERKLLTTSINNNKQYQP